MYLRKSLKIGLYSVCLLCPLPFGIIYLGGFGKALLPDSDIMDSDSNVAELPSFTQILIESGSDKFHRHHFEKYYEKWLPNFRHKHGLKLLEIGAKKGKSMKLWSDYFSDPALVLGLAYGQGTKKVDKSTARYKAVDIYFGDQSKKETMSHLNEKGPWDIIIDDGSHVPQHMIYSLFALWQSVKPGGMYIIEDLETNYWASGDGLYGYKLGNVGIGAGPEHSAIPKLQQLQEVLVRHQIGAKGLSVMDGDDSICSIEWGMNIVAIKKCEEDVQFPPFQKPRHDKTRMENWIKEAKKSNPK